MIIGIDASNIRDGGGVTHITEVLNNAKPVDFGFQKVVVWSGLKTLSSIDNHSWLEKVHVPALDGPLPKRLWWQQVVLPKLLEQHRCDLLFSPGGTLPCRLSLPAVTMSQNMLPFAPEEAARYEAVSMRLRLKLLNTVQRMSYQKADGLIFLTQYAKKSVWEQLKKKPPRTAIVPHGINEDFFLPPRKQTPLDSFSPTKPFRLLYVSNVDVYKHQWHVAEAVAALRDKGFPVAIDFVGSFYSQAMRKLKKTVQRVDSSGDFITYKSFFPYNELAKVYQSADAFIFASSCENMPNILLEAMAAGLPIACSDCDPMPEVLGNGGVYFDPESPHQIAKALRILIEGVDLREHCAWTAYKCAKKYSWKRCARETFSFLAEVVHFKCQNTDYDK